MRPYDFEALIDGTVVAAERMRLSDPRSVWAEVERLARLHNEPGCKIRVTDESGRIVVLTGVASVMRMRRAA
ncbi:MAG TPA: hypothetical protein VEH77_10090 [Roseiarcus sp.]|nr:hypothetical protein [Roseiarcus sp.]